jgi:hypothetical protein
MATQKDEATTKSEGKQGKQRTKRKQGKQRTIGMFMTAHYFFGVAEDAYGRAKTEDESSGQVMYPSLTAIIFSAITLEAVLNELAGFSQLPTFTSGPEEVRELLNPEKVRTLVTILNLMTDGNTGTVQLKLNAAYTILTNKEYPQGEAPHQSMGLLIRLRNELVHPKADVLRTGSPADASPSVTLHGLVNILQSQRILSKSDLGDDVASTFVSTVATPQVAKWACNTTLEVVKDLLRVLPNSSPKRMLQATFSQFIKNGIK